MCLCEIYPIRRIYNSQIEKLIWKLGHCFHAIPVFCYAYHVFHASVFNLLFEKPCSFAHSGRISISLWHSLQTARKLLLSVNRSPTLPARWCTSVALPLHTPGIFASQISRSAKYSALTSEYFAMRWRWVLDMGFTGLR